LRVEAKTPTKLNLNLYLDKRLQCKSSTAVVNLILCENDTKHLLFLIKQILSSIFKILKALVNIETFVTFQKSGLELLKIWQMCPCKNPPKPILHLSVTSLHFG
jgi:transcriptional regulator of heat shock response